MIQFYKGRFILFASLVLGLVFTTSCDKDMSVFLDRNSNDALNVSVIDSLTVKTSTYQLDYLPGAATGVLLVGKSTQSEIGSVKSSAYFELGLEDYIAGVPENAVFDSINLVLRPHTSVYSYGDTTAINKISIHKLTERIETRDINTGMEALEKPFYVTAPTVFNTKKFAYDPTELGAKSFTPRMRSMDSLDIRLNQTFGSDFFELMRNSDRRITNTNDFLSYFNGLVIVPDESNKAIIAFNDTLQVRFNYSYINSSGFKVNDFKVLSLGNVRHQYNNIEYDRTGTPFEALSSTKRELTLAETNGKLFLQAGTGAVTKINLKSLQKLMNEPNIAINKIELLIETNSQIDGFHPASTRLMLMVANSNNRPLTPLMSPFLNQMREPTALQPIFTPGDQSGKNGVYAFDLIQYSKLINTEAYEDATLFLSVVTPNLFWSTNATLIATSDNVPKIKLNIIYTKFQ